jgi:hypothetical protein
VTPPLYYPYAYVCGNLPLQTKNVPRRPRDKLKRKNVFLAIFPKTSCTKAEHFCQFRVACKNCSSELFFPISGVVNRHFFYNLLFFLLHNIILYYIHSLHSSLQVFKLGMVSTIFPRPRPLFLSPSPSPSPNFGLQSESESDEMAGSEKLWFLLSNLNLLKPGFSL